MSNYCSSIANKYDIKIGPINKLVPNLGNKSKHVLYYKNFQLHLPLASKLASQYLKILKFKKYIDFNTNKRKDAANSFEKGF